jgi:hypothetical protein
VRDENQGPTPLSHGYTSNRPRWNTSVNRLYSLTTFPAATGDRVTPPKLRWPTEMRIVKGQLE